MLLTTLALAAALQGTQDRDFRWSGRIAEGVANGYAVLGLAMVSGQIVLLVAAWRVMPAGSPRTSIACAR